MNYEGTFPTHRRIAREDEPPIGRRPRGGQRAPKPQCPGRCRVNSRLPSTHHGPEGGEAKRYYYYCHSHNHSSSHTKQIARTRFSGSLVRSPLAEPLWTSTTAAEF